MKCKICDFDATVLLLDAGRIRVPLDRFTPGGFIECDDPNSLEGYCEHHWWALTTAFPTPQIRWPEGAEL